MSDGDNATPGLPGAGPSHIGGDNQWLTRSARPSPGAAPWERNGSSNSGEAEQSAQTGNHTNGVTVADLIAKVHSASSVPEELRPTRAQPEPDLVAAILQSRVGQAGIDVGPVHRHTVAACIGHQGLRGVEAHRLGAQQRRTERGGMVQLEPGRVEHQ